MWLSRSWLLVASLLAVHWHGLDALRDESIFVSAPRLNAHADSDLIDSCLTTRPHVTMPAATMCTMAASAYSPASYSRTMDNPYHTLKRDRRASKSRAWQ